MREPLKTETVAFSLTNTGKETYAVALLVNGRNSIFPDEEERAPHDCAKWVLKPGQTTEIDAFQLTNKTTAKFEVKSDAESKKTAVNYGRNAGTFTIVIFREATSVAEKKYNENLKKEREEKTEQVLISRGTGKLVGMISASDPRSFQMSLRELTAKGEAALHNRGMVVAGAPGMKEVTDVVFQASPVPMYSATIRYYDPQHK